MTVTLAQLGALLRERRGGRGVRDVAKELGVSPATLSRVENGSTPDLETFKRVCLWLEVDPGEVLGVSGSVGRAAPPFATAHLRAKREISPDLARALGEMVLRVQAFGADEPTDESA